MSLIHSPPFFNAIVEIEFNGWKICEGPLWETWTFGDMSPQRKVGLISDTHDLNDDLNDDLNNLNDFIGISALKHFVDKKFSSTIEIKIFHLT